MSEERRGWFARLRAGLSKSSSALTDGINQIFTRRRLDATALDELEELLIASDMGVGVAGEVVEALRRSRFNQEVAPEEVRAALAAEIARLVEPVAKPLRCDPAKQPFVILVVGVNGSGKTTTIGKLATALKRNRRKVLLVAADTFRAAAAEQLTIWAERAGVDIVRGNEGADPSSVVFDGMVAAQSRGSDVVKRRFSVGEQGDSLEVEEIPVVPAGKPVVERFKRVPLSTASK